MQPIKTALSSFGMSGTLFHAPFLDVHPGFDLYAVWERTKNLAAEKYPAIKTYRSFEEMIADPQVELVIINTPNQTHYELSKQALMAGKHIVVEKPFTVNSKEAEELIDIGKKQKKLISVYHNRRFDSDFQTVKKIIDEGWLGKIVEAEIHFDRYKEELSYKQHKETPIPGTGMVFDLGSHLIDQALVLFGKPDAVFADIAIMRPVSKVDDYFELLLYYPGHRVRLRASYQVREPVPGFIIHGSKGSFLKSRADVQETDLLAGKKPGSKNWGIEPDTEKGLLHTEKDGKQIREHIPTIAGNYGLYYDGVFNAIRNDKPLPVTAEDGLNVIKVIESAFASNRERKVIDLREVPAESPATRTSN